jgi:transcriptional regulator with XRE-family HTH domain
MNPLSIQFGQNLSRCRHRTGLSQEEVSFRASLHRTEISLLERGLRLPRVDTALKLAAALGVGVDDLLEGVSWQCGEMSYGSFSIK